MHPHTTSTIKEYFLCKIDANFNKVWTYVGTGGVADLAFTKVQELEDGSFAILASGHKDQPGSYHIIRVSSSGQFISRTTYTSALTPQVRMYSWAFLGDGSVAVAGWGSNDEGYLARLQGVGRPAVVTGSSKEQGQEKLYLAQNYPNPANGEAWVEYAVPQQVQEARLKLHDIVTGRTVQELQLQERGEATVKLNLQGLPAGMYVYTLYLEGKPAATKKLVLIQ